METAPATRARLCQSSNSVALAWRARNESNWRVTRLKVVSSNGVRDVVCES